MMANDWQRLNIWLKLDNKFDYQAFGSACNAAGCEPQSAMEFAQKAGMVTAGMLAYPELPVAEAYLKFIADNQQAYTPPQRQQQPQPQQPPAVDGIPAGYKKEKVTITFSDGRTEEQEILTPDGTQKQGCCGGGAIK